MIARNIGIFIVGLALASCQHTAPSKAVNVSDLFQVSNETVTFPIGDEDSVMAALHWMDEDAPSSANITCQDGRGQCQEVIQYLQKNAIPYDVVDGADVLKLSYQRVTAHECTSGVGCSSATNTIQMVSDYGQFFSPALSAPQDAASAVHSYRSLVLNQE